MSEIVLEFDSNSKALISTTGASVLELSLESKNIIKKPKYAQSIFAGAILAPWQNRIAHGLWVDDSGNSFELPINEAELGNAHHGLVFDYDFEIVKQAQASVVLAARIPFVAGYPFNVELEINYELTGEGFYCGFRVDNAGHETAPFVIGFHPYFALGDPESAILTMPAASFYTQNANKIPVAKVPTVGTEFDFSKGRALGNLGIDDFFTDLRVVDSEIITRLKTPSWCIQLRQSENLKHTVIYRTDNYETEQGVISALAVEPASASADAFNSKEDLVFLRPKESFAGSWSVVLAAE